ncbi:MAG: DUF2232 domain-containing protein [Gemmatimonadales bacterium]
MGYLLFAPPVFALCPLAGLLLLSRPRTIREWGWLLGTAAWSALWLQQVGGLGAQVVRAGAVFLCGSFLALTLWRPSAGFSRALLATAGAGITLVAWMAWLGIKWVAVQQAIEHDLSTYQAMARTQWTAAGAPKELLSELGAMPHTIAQLTPGLLAIAGIAGLRLAWTWYHRLASRPWGAATSPFPAFRFSDQLVWGWVVALGLSLLPVAAPWPLVGANLLLVWSALYATRGLAVLLAMSGRIPRPVAAVLALIAMFLLPFVLGGLTLLGLADTWLDFRRRLSTPTTGGLDR